MATVTSNRHSTPRRKLRRNSLPVSTMALLIRDLGSCCRQRQSSLSFIKPHKREIRRRQIRRFGKPFHRNWESFCFIDGNVNLPGVQNRHSAQLVPKIVPNYYYFFHFFLHMSCSSKPYLKRAPSNAIWKSENPFTDTLHFCSSCKSHTSGVSLNTSVFVTKHYYILCEVQADFLYVIISTSDSKLL